LLRTRRNHGLEHATIHVLSAKYPRTAMAGHSDANGFWLWGDLTSEQVEQGVQEALARLRAGEKWLAVHPNCGTNLVTAATFTGLAGVAAMGGSRQRGLADRLPLAILLSMLGLLAARPLGNRLQARVTTSGDPGDLRVLSIRRTTRGNSIAHRVATIS
jgi:hypothetical protein